MIQVFKNDSVELFYYPELKISRINYTGIVNMEEIIEAYKFIMEKNSKAESFAVIADLTHLRGTYTMLINYLKDTVYPFMAQKKIRYNAIISSSDIFIKFSTRKLIENIKNVELKIFENEKDAFAWINEKV